MVRHARPASPWPARGDGLLAGNAPHYRCYECADGGYVAVGALEPHFFEALWRRLGLGEPPDSRTRTNWLFIEQNLSKAFLTRSRDEWAAFFAGTDCCVTPVLAPDEVWRDPQIAHRHPGANAGAVPVVPRLSRTPGMTGSPAVADETEAILSEAGLSADEIAAARPAKSHEPPPDLI
ncbi:MAG: CoA transferase [Rhodomicrobium sp.]|nr:CoA transferase [Rhodomicrobium sp.]